MNSFTETRVLAIDPTTKGFAFGVLEGGSLIDWGLKSVSPRGNKQGQSLARVRLLVELYQPAVIVLEDCSLRSCRRCPRVRRLIERVRRLARDAGTKARLVSRAQVRRAFAPAHTKHEIATAIAQRFLELAPILPRRRTAAMSVEDGRMNVFDALSLGLAFLSRTPRNPGSDPVPTPLGETR